MEVFFEWKSPSLAWYGERGSGAKLWGEGRDLSILVGGARCPLNPKRKIEKCRGRLEGGDLGEKKRVNEA